MESKPLLLFDMDGTLICVEEKPDYTRFSTSYTPYVSLRQKMKEIAVSKGVPEETYFNLNRMALIWNATRNYAENEGYTEKQITDLMQGINIPFTEEERDEHEKSVLLLGVIETLKHLGNHYNMGLVTTASRKAYETVSTDSKFGCFGKYFTHSITRDDCDYIKPDPEPINRILRKFRRSNFIYVGDSDHDAKAAKAAGGVFILINTRGYDAETIRELNPYIVIDNLKELPEELLKLSEERVSGSK